MINKFPFKVLHDVSLASLSTFSLGGTADNYIVVEKLTDLKLILNYLHNKNIEFKVFSGGSNIVFPDEGIKSYLVHVKNGNLKKQKNIIIADAGVVFASIIQLAINSGLKGLENLSGIPGSIGAAVVGNAGAYGSSVSDVVKKVHIWRNGKTGFLSKEECLFLYRDSIFKHKPFIILRVILELEHSQKETLIKTSEEIIKIREQKYKPGLKCPGSFFKNVLVTDLSTKILAQINQSVIIAGKIPAGFLLTEVGARGLRVGGIEVSDFHGNLLINNTGNGKASDVKKLSSILKQKVYAKFGITLEEEVRYF